MLSIPFLPLAAMFDELVAIQHELFSSLGLHYRMLDMPTEDLGAPAYRKHDIEAWMPGRGAYGEVCSVVACFGFNVAIKFDMWSRA